MGHVCNCPKPPGGQVECDLHQLAICRVTRGVPETWCVSPPKKERVQELWNWALEQITDIERSPSQAVTVPDLDILSAGRYEDPGRQIVVTFTLPVGMGMTTA
jgi:hypothetical protein